MMKGIRRIMPRLDYEERIKRLRNYIGYELIPSTSVRRFLGSIQIIVEDVSEPLAYTDGAAIYISTYYLRGDINIGAEAILHEMLHIVLGHPLRAKRFRLQFLWNLATDLIVDTILSKYVFKRRLGHIEELLTIAKEVLRRHKLGEKYNEFRSLVNQVLDAPLEWTAERIYNRIIEIFGASNVEKIMMRIWTALSSIYGEKHGWDDIDDESYGIYSLAVELRVLKAIIGERGRDEWINMLRKNIVAGPPGSYVLTWRRPSRKMIPHGHYYPRKSSPLLKRVMIAADVSGSIDEEDYNKIVYEIAKLLSTIHVEELIIIQFDADIVHIDKLVYPGFWDIYHAMEIRYGMGGTLYTPVFDYVEKNIGYVDALIILTDGYGEFPEYKPNIRTIWVLVGSHINNKIPFGEVIYSG